MIGIPGWLRTVSAIDNFCQFDRTSDRLYFVAVSIAYRLYFKPSCWGEKSSGAKNYTIVRVGALPDG